MSVASIINSIINDVPKTVAAGLVDIETGRLLGIKTVNKPPKEVMTMLTSATRDIFEGSNVTSIEAIFKKARGDSSDDHYFKEIMVISTNLIHVFSRLKSRPSLVIISVCQDNANMGLVVVKMHEIANKATL